MSGNRSGGCIEPDTSIRKTKLLGGRLSCAISRPLRPTRTKRCSEFHGQPAISMLAANALLQIVDALNYPPATCGPTKVTALKIYPPNQTAPVYLPSATTACSKPVAIMNIGPVQAGSGGSG